MKSYKRIKCRDGFTMSVQASQNGYCSPRMNNALSYTEVEVGYPSMIEKLLLPYVEDAAKPLNSVYGWVPVEVVAKVIQSHGGMIDGELPRSTGFVSVDPKYGIEKNEI